jgi:AraC-like DNA-binding protein
VPKKPHSPIFRGGGGIYRIDSQVAQRRALAAGRVEIRGLTHGNYIGRQLPGDVLPGLSSVGWMNMVGEQDWGTELHRNEGIEIVFLEAGETPFLVDGSSHHLRAGDLTVTRPWQLHQLGNPNIGAVRLHWVIIDVGVRRPNQAWRWPPWVILSPRDREELTVKLSQNDKAICRSSPAIPWAFAQIAGVLDHPDPLSRLSHLTVQLNVLILELLESLRQESFSHDPHLISHEHTVELFVRDLKSDPIGLAQAWTLQTMAAECGLGPTAFRKYCRKMTNASPMDYLKRCRLEMAAKVLTEEPGRSVTDIAFACGFSSSQYFAYQFGRTYGHTPQAHRKLSLSGRKPS